MAKMAKEIQKYICRCKVWCKKKQSEKTEPHYKTPFSSRWCFAINVHGHHGATSRVRKGRNQYILVMEKYLTWYVITASMPDETAETAANIGKNFILIYWVPEKVFTDQGTNFQSELMDILYKTYRINRLKTTADGPQCDGMIERGNRSLAEIIAIFVSREPTKGSNFLPLVTFAYNTTEHVRTGYSPFYIMSWREAIEP